MRIAMKGSFCTAFCGFAAILVACGSVSLASPITHSVQNQGTTTSKLNLPPSVPPTENTGQRRREVKPSDLTTSAPVKPRETRKNESTSGGAKSESYGASASRDIPDIPWETIEQVLKRENQLSPSRQEPKVVVGGEHQQLIVNLLPDFTLDIVNLPGPQNIPILDFLKTRSALLSSEIALYTSDLATPDHTIDMASNGNLDSENDATESGRLGSEENRPFKLKNLFFWGLGLLVLYTLLDAIFSKLKGRDSSNSREPAYTEDTKARSPRRRRSFRRSRARHRHS